jgi:hypothetical protein
MTNVMFGTIYDDSDKVISDIAIWLYNNVGDYQWQWIYWRIGSIYSRINGVEFTNEEDAVAFKLKFQYDTCTI